MTSEHDLRAMADRAFHAVFGDPPASEDHGPDKQEPTPASGRSARLVRVADVAPERITWLWDGYVPARKLTVIDGDPGDGKSTLTLDLAARITTGSPMPDGSPSKQGSVLVLSAEDGIGDTIRPRLDAAGADVNRVFVLDEITEDGIARPPELPADLAAIAAIIAKHEITLVAVDPLAAFLAGSVDSYRDQDVRRVLHPLSKLADATGAAFVVVRHMTKAGGAKAVYRGGGSIGIIGAARAGYVVAPDPDDDSRRVLACQKMNVAVHPASLAYRLVGDDEHGCARVKWEGVTQHRADDLVNHEDGRGEAEEFILGTLADGPVPAKEVLAAAKAAGIPRSTLMRAKARLQVDSTKEGFADGWTWLPPPQESTKGPRVRSKTLRDPSDDPDDAVVRMRDWTARTRDRVERELGEPL